MIDEDEVFNREQFDLYRLANMATNNDFKTKGVKLDSEIDNYSKIIKETSDITRLPHFNKFMKFIEPTHEFMTNQFLVIDELEATGIKYVTFYRFYDDDKKLVTYLLINTEDKTKVSAGFYSMAAINSIPLSTISKKSKRFRNLTLSLNSLLHQKKEFKRNNNIRLNSFGGETFYKKAV